MIGNLTSSQIDRLDRSMTRASIYLAVLAWGSILIPALGGALDVITR